MKYKLLNILVALPASILADHYHPTLTNIPKGSDQFTEPVCEVGQECKISMSPMNENIKQIRHWAEEEETEAFWREKTMAEVDQAMKVTSNPITKKAKYSIIFLGDGMGIPSVTAGRIYSGQQLGMINAESYKTGLDNVAHDGHTGFSKTYCVDRQTTDSAASATAYLTGVKAMYQTLGVTAKARLADCESATEDTHVESVLKKAKRKGLATGIVTTTRVHHASPGGAFANSPYRNWYSDADMSEEAKKAGCKDLAYQVVQNSDLVDVHMGGGYKYFIENTEKTPFTSSGKREDGVNLLEEWKLMNPDGKIVSTKAEMAEAKNGEKILGLFADSDIEYHQKQMDDIEKGVAASEVWKNTPTLKDMTEKAIESLLATSEDGFYLFVEGGRIDHGHHDGSAYRALEEFDQFQQTVEFVRSHPKLNKEETLIVITADHSHTFSIGGYGWRGYDVRSAAPTDIWARSLDNMPFSTLGYAQGAGYRGSEENFGENGAREDLRKLGEEAMKSYEYQQQAAAPVASETHGGEDVAIIASGPWSHLYTGIHEQTYVAYVMMKAQCLGPYENDDHCVQDDTPTTDASDTSASKVNSFALSVLVIVGVLSLF